MQVKKCDYIKIFVTASVPANVKKAILCLKYDNLFNDIWLTNSNTVGIGLLHSAN